MLDRTDIKYFKMAVGNNIKTETAVDIAANCPVCGDSRHSNKARLHLYLGGKETYVNCFNGGCPVENRIMYTFLRDFFPDLLPAYKRETFDTRMSKLKDEFNNKQTSGSNINVFGDSRNSNSDFSFESFISEAPGNKTETSETTNAFGGLSKKAKETKVIPEKQNVIEPQDYLRLEPKDHIETLALEQFFGSLENSPAEEYLKSRGFDKSIQEKYGKFYYGTQNIQLDSETLYIKDSIIIPLLYENRIYGFYSRSINQKKFHTFIHKNSGYKIWNYFNVKPEPVYVFEGIFDAMSSGLDNVIASLGAKIPDDRLRDLQEYCSEVIFVLDGDRTGLMNSLEYAQRGYTVHVPTSRDAKDINELMLHGTPKELIKSNIINNLYKGITAQIKIKQLL